MHSARRVKTKHPQEHLDRLKYTTRTVVLPVLERLEKLQDKKFKKQFQAVGEMIGSSEKKGFPVEGLKKYESELRALAPNALHLDEWGKLFGRQWTSSSTSLAAITCMILVTIASDSSPLFSPELVNRKVFKERFAVVVKSMVPPDCVENVRKIIAEIIADRSAESRGVAVIKVVLGCLQRWRDPNLKNCETVKNVLNQFPKPIEEDENKRQYVRRAGRRLKEVLAKIFPNVAKRGAV